MQRLFVNFAAIDIQNFCNNTKIHDYLSQPARSKYLPLIYNRAVFNVFLALKNNALSGKMEINVVALLSRRFSQKPWTLRITEQDLKR